jgi:hypothetical protein
MHIKSENANKPVRVTRTQADASKDAEQSATSYSSVVFGKSYERYWDDAYGRDAKLSVYAFDVPDDDGGSKATSKKSAAKKSTSKAKTKKAAPVDDDDDLPFE